MTVADEVTNGVSAPTVQTVKHVQVFDVTGSDMAEDVEVISPVPESPPTRLVTERSKMKSLHSPLTQILLLSLVAFFGPGMYACNKDDIFTMIQL